MKLDSNPSELAIQSSTSTNHAKYDDGGLASHSQPVLLKAAILTLLTQILETIGTDDPYNLYVYGTFLTEYLTYWLVASLYMVLDFTQRPKFLHKYKTQPGTNEPPNMRKFVKARNEQ